MESYIIMSVFKYTCLCNTVVGSSCISLITVTRSLDIVILVTNKHKIVAKLFSNGMIISFRLSKSIGACF